jgi:hypothetical protein
MMEKTCAKNDSLKIMMKASYISCSDVRSTKLCEKATLYWEATEERLRNTSPILIDGGDYLTMTDQQAGQLLSRRSDLHPVRA